MGRKGISDGGVKRSVVALVNGGVMGFLLSSTRFHCILYVSLSDGICHTRTGVIRVYKEPCARSLSGFSSFPFLFTQPLVF